MARISASLDSFTPIMLENDNKTSPLFINAAPISAGPVLTLAACAIDTNLENWT